MIDQYMWMWVILWYNVKEMVLFYYMIDIYPKALEVHSHNFLLQVLPTWQPYINLGMLNKIPTFHQEWMVDLEINLTSNSRDCTLFFFLSVQFRFWVCSQSCATITTTNLEHFRHPLKRPPTLKLSLLIPPNSLPSRDRQWLMHFLFL